LIMGERVHHKIATFCNYQNNFMSVKAHFKPIFSPTTGAYGGYSVKHGATV
jgi:hypothetical protein